MELLAPGGDIDSIKAAIAAGADAVYCGLDRFNARNSAENIGYKDLPGIIWLAHENNCEVFLTLNIIIVDSEIPALTALLNKLVNTGIDGIIVQDLGLLYILSVYFRSLKIHASTQLTTHNEGQVRFLHKLGATRVNLSRELNIQEIRDLSAAAHQQHVLTEVFVHGSYCISFSGICYMSSVHGGKSGNRGRCSQPCRDQYVTTPRGKDFPLNLKDNSAFADIRELQDAGVDSLKIEGRIKKYEYVYTVANSWRQQLRKLYDHRAISTDKCELYKVFNRDFSDSFLKGDIHKEMFIDSPRDHSLKHLFGINDDAGGDAREKLQEDLNGEKDKIRATIEDKISRMHIARVPLSIVISGKCGAPLNVAVKTPDASFGVLSDMNLAATGTEALNEEMILKRLKAINDTAYYIRHLELEELQGGLFLPFRELTSIKKRILFILNGAKETIEPVAVPVLKKHSSPGPKPTLSALISSRKDLYLCQETSAAICFQLPDSLREDFSAFIDLFRENRKLIPWFPPVLIGEDYKAAVEFLHQVKPKLIVTNNSGIALEAAEKGISWIAGPFLNIVNSYSLLCLKEKFNCSGAFISNEINKQQIRLIKKPGDFNLYYSICHPIVLMTSRQCLFHQVVGCEKEKIDAACISQCSRSSSITNLKKVSFVIEKSKGNYHRIYNEVNYLNTDVLTDVPDLFSGFSIDLRDIKTGTTLGADKPDIIRLFESHLNGDAGSAQELKNMIHPSTNAQYLKGI